MLAPDEVNVLTKWFLPSFPRQPPYCENLPVIESCCSKLVLGFTKSSSLGVVQAPLHVATKQTSVHLSHPGLAGVVPLVLVKAAAASSYEDFTHSKSLTLGPSVATCTADK